eukprot:gb/GECG01011524.1/.p1 GENE.gb/GECG01011524.1/~~gb/GECG01011524.1/.p1  ORF type:complete len:429 (+),score=51.62 gb/GECG01011524.1/:1-1287(+)
MEEEVRTEDGTRASGLELPRFVRVPVKFKEEFDPELFYSETGTRLYPVWWLPSCYCIPGNVKIAHTTASKKSHIVGIDAASLAAVYALEPGKGENVLDLCCAPGAKLNAITELMNYNGTVTGVDISYKRLRSVVHSTRRLRTSEKGILQPNFRVRLVHSDGKSFNMPPPTIINGPGFVQLNANQATKYPTRDRSKKRKVDPAATIDERDRSCSDDCLLDSAVDNRWKNVALDRKEQNETETSEIGGSNNLYDKILVDAECTHDGSMKHIMEFQTKRSTPYWSSQVTDERIGQLTTTQKDILRNAFQLLKVDGTLIYSTCSLTTAQNEEVIDTFLQEHHNASLSDINLEQVASDNWSTFKSTQPIAGSEYSLPDTCAFHCPASRSMPPFPWKYGTIPRGENKITHAIVRFEPKISKTGGLFICRIKKVG